ncbi:MAG: hypothetical protein K0U45_01315 [Alphaproteobacteria bacterium]|nr:hypothetical protein [Alphaproteobacteria bacterium]
MNFEKLFNEVFQCDGEENLHELVTNNDLLKNPNNWYPYGGKDKNDRSNFGTFENQQSDSGAALVEKITNSTDALLLKKCKQQTINPKSSEAPKTIERAVELFFEIPKGEIGELTSTDRTQLSRDNIQIIATGAAKSPDIIIWDNGEGQHPDDFKDTFLSLAKNNKTDIKFVQGKYNMGSTGAVTFCGEYRYQLIASKKDNQIFDNEKKHKDNLFGWTLVRRHVLTTEEDKKYGSSWYEYFAIEAATIPQFLMDDLAIGLHQEKKFTTGSFVKLYSYEMPKGAQTSIISGLYDELNQLLYKPALPIWLYEKRKKYDTSKGRSDIGVYGNHVRINNPDTKENLECEPIYQKYNDNKMGCLKIQVVVFKQGESSQQQTDRRRHYIGAGRNVIYTVNGQAHATEGVSLITQDLKYYFLKNSMLVVIDCSDLKTDFRQDLFMANRTTLKQSNKLNTLKNKVIELLKDNSKLKELNTQRKDAILQGGDDKKEQELINNILSKVPLDKSLTNLLKKGMDLIQLPTVKQQTGTKSKKEKRPIESKRFPALFKSNVKEDQSTGKKVKSIPLNGKASIEFETGVVDNYLYRPQEKGEFQLHILGGENINDSDNPDPKPHPPSPTKVEDSFDVTLEPNDGSIKLTLKPKENLNVGDEIELNARLTSPNGDMESIFYVKIIDPQKQELQKTQQEPERPNLPQLIKITQKEDGKWQGDNGRICDDGEWNKNKIINIIPSDGGNQKMVDAIAINMDSNILKKYISNNKTKNEKEIEYYRNQYMSKIYLHGLFLYSILHKIDFENQKENGKKHASDEDSVEDKISEIFEHYSNVLIHLDANQELIKSISAE